MVNEFGTDEQRGYVKPHLLGDPSHAQGRRFRTDEQRGYVAGNPRTIEKGISVDTRGPNHRKRNMSGP